MKSLKNLYRLCKEPSLVLVWVALAVTVGLLGVGLWLASPGGLLFVAGLAAGCLVTHVVKESNSERSKTWDEIRDDLPTLVGMAKEVEQLERITGEQELVIAAVVPATAEMHLPFARPELVEAYRP